MKKTGASTGSTGVQVLERHVQQFLVQTQQKKKQSWRSIDRSDIFCY